MLTVFQTHPLIIGAVLALLDLSLWRWVGASRPVWRMCSRIAVFVGFSWVLIAAGISPLQPPLWPDDAVLNLMGAQLEQFSDLHLALDKLVHQREEIRESGVAKKPVHTKRSGFLGWLQKKRLPSA